MNIPKFKPLKLKDKIYPQNISSATRMVLIYKDNKKAIDKFCTENSLDIQDTLNKLMELAKAKDLEKQELAQKLEQVKMFQIKNTAQDIKKQDLPTIIIPKRKLTRLPIPDFNLNKSKSLVKSKF